MCLAWRNKRERSRRILREEGGCKRKGGVLIAFSPGKIEEHLQSKMEAFPIGPLTYLHVCAIRERVVWGHSRMAGKSPRGVNSLGFLDSPSPYKPASLF